MTQQTVKIAVEKVVRKRINSYELFSPNKGRLRGVFPSFKRGDTIIVTKRYSSTIPNKL